MCFEVTPRVKPCRNKAFNNVTRIDGLERQFFVELYSVGPTLHTLHNVFMVFSLRNPANVQLVMIVAS